ncbi:MAG: hypothetical protein Q8P86_03865, partial [bacterium]|nr:hypothetical protein [bacterium]
SAEPWLIKPISEVSVDVQLDRMSMEKFKETLEFAPKTGFDTQYLWGVEWWYRLKKGGNSEFWEYAKSIISVNY